MVLLGLFPFLVWLPAVIATTAVTTVQLVGATAGRGRPVPGAGYARLARYGTVAAVILAVAAGPLPAEAVVPWGLAAGLFTIGCEAVARRGGPSPALASLVLGIVFTMMHVRGAWPLGAALLAAAALAPLVAVRLPLGALRLDRDRLARLGITPWSRAEIGLVPLALAVAGRIGLSGILPVGALGALELPAALLGVALATAATIRALAYLDLRLRVAEVCGPGRRTARPGAVPPAAATAAAPAPAADPERTA